MEDWKEDSPRKRMNKTRAKRARENGDLGYDRLFEFLKIPNPEKKNYESLG